MRLLRRTSTLAVMDSISKIFGSAARLKTLRLFVFNKDTSFTIAEVAERAKIANEVARSEINDLVAADLLRKKGAMTPIHFQINQRFEHLSALETFIRDTTNVRPENLVKSLRKAGALRLVVLSGLFSSVLEPQIDILVVGDHLDERILATSVRSLEAELGREIRYASFATPDFRYRRGVYDRLLRDVFDYPHRVLIDKIGL